MKVLMLLTDLSVANGVTSYAMNYFRKLGPDVQMDFAVYLRSTVSYEKEIISRGGHVFYLPPLKKLKAHTKACREILKNGYDVVHDTTLIMTIPMMSEAKKAGVPVRILHSHSAKLSENKIKEIRNKFFMPFLTRSVTDYAACSDIAGGIFNGKEYTFLPNVIDFDRFKIDEAKRNETRVAEGAGADTIFITVGRLSEAKNLTYAIDRIGDLYKKRKDIQLWIVGDGPQKEMFRQLALEKKLPCVRILGIRKDAEALYNAADCFLMPSWFEGLPVTALEAQASGLPCLLSDTITRQANFSGKIAYLSLSSPDAWASAMSAIHAEPHTSSGKGKADADAEVFNDENAGRLIEEYYEKCLQKK